MLDLRNLETFLWVSRLGGFRAAAERLNTTQPAISARIAILERDLGARLFDRRARRVVLTAKGSELVDYVEKMLQLRADMLGAIGNPASLRGSLRLGVPETIVHTWLAELVEQISSTYPSVTLDIEVDSTPALREGLLAEKLDLAFLHGKTDDSRLTTAPLCAYPLGWFAGRKVTFPKRALTFKDICRWPIVTFRRESAPHVAIRKMLSGVGMADARIFGSSSIAGTMRMAIDGIGPCVLPYAVVRHEVAAGKLRQLDVPYSVPPIEFFVSYAAKGGNRLAASVAEVATAIAERHLDTRRPDARARPSKVSIGRIQKKN